MKESISKFYYIWYQVFLWTSRKLFSLGYKIDSLTNSARRASERWSNK